MENMENVEFPWKNPKNTVFEVFLFHTFSTFSILTKKDFPLFPPFSTGKMEENRGFERVEVVFPDFPCFPEVVN